MSALARLVLSWLTAATFVPSGGPSPQVSFAHVPPSPGRPFVALTLRLQDARTYRKVSLGCTAALVSGGRRKGLLVRVARRPKGTAAPALSLCVVAVPRGTGGQTLTVFSSWTLERLTSAAHYDGIPMSWRIRR